MARCLANNTALRHLDIAFNWIDPEMCDMLSTALLSNKTLIGLHVLGNACTVDIQGFMHV